MVEWRRHPRVREEIKVRWSVPSKSLKGDGVIRNVSISGLLMEVDEQFFPFDDANVVIEIDGSDLNSFLPREGKMVWFTTIVSDRKRNFCGLKFIDPSGDTVGRLKKHVDGRLVSSLDAMDLNIMSNYLNQSN